MSLLQALKLVSGSSVRPFAGLLSQRPIIRTLFSKSTKKRTIEAVIPADPIRAAVSPLAVPPEAFPVLSVAFSRRHIPSATKLFTDEELAHACEHVTQTKIRALILELAKRDLFTQFQILFSVAVKKRPINPYFWRLISSASKQLDSTLHFEIVLQWVKNISLRNEKYFSFSNQMYECDQKIKGKMATLIVKQFLAEPTKTPFLLDGTLRDLTQLATGTFHGLYDTPIFTLSQFGLIFQELYSSNRDFLLSQLSMIANSHEDAVTALSINEDVLFWALNNLPKNEARHLAKLLLINRAAYLFGPRARKLVNKIVNS